MIDGLRRAIEIAGGVTALGKRIGVGQSNVSNWLRRGRVPVDPVNYVLAIEREIGIPRTELRPDVYPS